jgi:hypothetical protein
VDRYALADEAWRRVGTLSVDLADEFDRISPPSSRGPGRRLLHLTRAGSGFTKVVQERAEDADGHWVAIGEPYTAASLGVDGVFDPSLTPDGLRMVFSGFGLSGDYAVYYADRPTSDARFGAANRIFALIGNGQALSPFLSQNCERMYFYAAPGIHYVR